MASLLGVTAICIASLITFFLAARAPVIAKILVVAFIIRLVLSLFNVYIGDLPDSTQDALTFELFAWEWSQTNFTEVIKRFPDVNHGFIISWIISILYNLTDRSLLAAQTLGMIFGIFSIYFGWKLLEEVWSEKIAIKGAWILAIFPTWVLYSVITMREVYIYFFSIIGLLGFVRWLKYNKFYDIALVLLGFGVTAQFHGVMIIGLLVFLFFAFCRSLNSVVFLTKNLSSFISQLIIFSISIFLLILFFQSKFGIQYIGSIDSLSIDLFADQFRLSASGDSSIPQWLIPEGLFDTFLKTPIRIFYFLFGPMPWDISKPIHVFGMIDSILYLILFVFIMKNRKVLIKNQSSKALLYILAVYILVFSLGVANSGTAIRHKAKLLPIIIVLAAPSLPIITLGHQKLHRRLKNEKGSD